MGTYNVLILSVGRRVELVERFKETAKSMKIKSNIIGADASSHAPALYFSDKKYIIPKINEEGYIEAIIKICKENDVKLIIPTIDTELLILSENKQYIESQSSAKIMISDLEVIEICRDKIKTQKFLEKNGFLMPKMYSSNQIDNSVIKYPLFIKPKSGSSSVGAFKVNNKTEMELYIKVTEEPIIQDFLEGDEYTVDVFLDFEGDVISIVPRQRIATRSGEISIGKTVKDKEIILEIKQLIKILKPIGQITIQLVKTIRGLEFIEINPRFGGGAPMSIDVGANSCEYLYRLLMGDQLSYREEWEDGVTLARFDHSVRVN